MFMTFRQTLKKREYISLAPAGNQKDERKKRLTEVQLLETGNIPQDKPVTGDGNTSVKV